MTGATSARAGCSRSWSAAGAAEYRLDAGVTLSTIRFPIAATRDSVREDMIVQLSIAEFDVKRGVWYVFAFNCPYAWQTL